MISILRGSFDIIMPCVLDAAGRCKLPSQMSGDMDKLEKMLGCHVAGANLKDFGRRRSFGVRFQMISELSLQGPVFVGST